MDPWAPLEDEDPEIYQAVTDEAERTRSHLELIASESYPSLAVLQATGSIMTAKYAEGYPGRRYYGGCEFVDVTEQLAIAPRSYSERSTSTCSRTPGRRPTWRSTTRCSSAATR